jgi:hypothetical protein
METGLIKYSSTDDFKSDVAPIYIINEQNDLVKRAADKTIEKRKSDGKYGKQTDLHVIALGSYEGYGANRNLDSFSEEDCRKNKDTFLKAWGQPDGRGVCRNHKNKPKDPRYGTIKQASYNDKMRRLELLIGLDNDKCGPEIEKVASGGQVCFSMAAKLAHDTCSECGHKSYDGDKDRCDCIKHKLGDITKTGNIIHMLNPNPNWGELSIVGRPADRIAYSIKTASTHLTPKVAFIGDELDDVPDRLKVSKKASDKHTIISKLAEIEKRIDAVGVKASKEKLDSAKADRKHLSQETIEELRRWEPSKVFKELADNGIVLTPEEFMKYLFADKVKDGDVEGMKSHLKDVYSEADKKHGGEIANNERFEPASIGGLMQKAKNMVAKLREGHSFFGEPAKRRVMSMTIVMGFKPKEAAYRDKTASVSDEALAKQYAAYKVAAVNYLDEQNKLEDGMLDLIVWQNRI